MANIDIPDTCPICAVTTLRRASCSNAACGFYVITCPTCDREQAVRGFVSEHESGCDHGPGQPGQVAGNPTFRAPRRAA